MTKMLSERLVITLLTLPCLAPAASAGGLALGPGPVPLTVEKEEKDGWALMRKRDYSAALTRFEREVRKYPEWAELHDAMGWCHYFLGEYEEATSCFEQALEHKSDYKWSLEGLEAVASVRSAPLEEADSLLAASRFVEARAAYQRIYEGMTPAGDSAKAKALRGEGWCLYYLSRFSDAIKSFRKARKLDRADVESLRGIGLSEYAQGDYRRAITTLQLALEVDPSHYLTYLTVGWSHYYLGGHEDALAVFERARALVEGAWGASSGRAWSLFQLGREDEALEAFAEALRINSSVKGGDLSSLIESRPGWRRLHNIAGWTALAEGFNLRALAEFESSAQLQCDVPEALAGQAFALFRQERYDEALERLERALASGEGDRPHSFGVQLSDGGQISVDMNLSSVRAWIAYRQGRYDEALGLFRTLRTEHPGWVDAACGEGWVLYTQGNYPAAEQVFEQALQLAPGYSDAATGLESVAAWRYADYKSAWSLLLEGKTESAEGLFRRIQEESSLPFPRDRMELIEASLGWTAYYKGDRAAAVGFFRKALELRPGLGLAEQGWGLLLMQQEQWELAAEHLARALETKELAEDTETWVQLGLAHLRGNQLTEAGRAFERAVELGPNSATAHKGQALYSLRTGQKVDARVALERAVYLDPSVAEDEVVRAKLNEEPELHRVHSALGWAWYYREEYAKALVEFELARERDPLEQSAIRGRGFCLLRLGRIKEGQRALEEHLRDAPRSEDPWGAWSTVYSELGWALYRDEQYRAAIRFFKKLEGLHERQKLEYADPHDGLGWCYLRQGKERPAREAFHKALEIDSTYESSLTGLQTLGAEGSDD